MRRIRSQRALASAIRFWLFVGVIAGFGLNTWGTALTGDRLWPPGIAAGAVLALAGTAWSVPRMALVLNEKGVEIHNTLRTWRAAWAEIAEIGMMHTGLPSGVSRYVPGFLHGPGAPAVGFRLHDGSLSPAAQATAYLDGTERESAVAELRRLAEANGIAITLQPEELA